MFTEAFVVVTVAPLGAENQWLVRGRAYNDVQINDMLYLESVDAEIGQESHAFKVERIVTYGTEVPELSRIMTGDLTLRGEHGDLIRENMILVLR